jgi:hypothetical protein
MMVLRGSDQISEKWHGAAQHNTFADVEIVGMT